MNATFSQEFLNAFVDGELAAEEHTAAMDRLDSDAEFKRAVCELRVLKERVKSAYVQPPATGHLPNWISAPAWRQALAAVLLLGFGLTGGWFARDASVSGPYTRLDGLPNDYRPISFVKTYDPNKIVLHLDSGDVARFEKTLALAERLLNQRGDSAKIEIVANGQGLDWLRRDVTPYAERIEQLAHRHANLTFIACGQAISILQRDGVKVVLVPSVEVTTSAADEIFARLNQGWVYVKV